MLRFIKTIVLGGVFGVTYIDVFGYVARVEGESMRPTLNQNPIDCDYVYLNKFSAKDYSVNRGEVVCLISPKDAQQRIIKRVTAKEGDTITTVGYKEKMVKIPQGEQTIEIDFSDHDKTLFFLGHFWVEGDHIHNSLDSNTFGPIPLGLLTAKATHIVWPPHRWRTLSSEPIRHPMKLGKNETLNNS
jgi:mitochondrial inner membrane protease subunit 2